jgi:hypothetical protein
VPVDLSKFPKVPWTENGKALGITYQGTDGAHFMLACVLLSAGSQQCGGGASAGHVLS